MEPCCCDRLDKVLAGELRRRVDGGVDFRLYKDMHPIRVLRKREGETGWEVAVMVGKNEDRNVGFLVKIDKTYWRNLTGGICSPEHLTRITFDFLLHKKQSVYMLSRIIVAMELPKEFPDYEDEVHRKLTGAFGL